MSWFLLLCTIASSQEVCEIRGWYQLQQDCEMAVQRMPVRYNEYCKCENKDGDQTGIPTGGD